MIWEVLTAMIIMISAITGYYVFTPMIRELMAVADDSPAPDWLIDLIWDIWNTWPLLFIAGAFVYLFISTRTREYEVYYR